MSGRPTHRGESASAAAPAARRVPRFWRIAHPRGESAGPSRDRTIGLLLARADDGKLAALLTRGETEGARRAPKGPTTDPRAHALRSRYHDLFEAPELRVPVESIVVGFAVQRAKVLVCPSELGPRTRRPRVSRGGHLPPLPSEDDS